MSHPNDGEGLRFDGVRALFINATLKRSPEPSNTDGLVRLSSRIMRDHGAHVEEVRAVDHDIATGVWPDMTEHGWQSDAWPTSSSRCGPPTFWCSPAPSGSGTTAP